jgi:hypothetical protein
LWITTTPAQYMITTSTKQRLFIKRIRPNDYFLSNYNISVAKGNIGSESVITFLNITH